MYKCTYNKYMAYQWDSEKAASNLRKHGIDFANGCLFFQMIWQLLSQMNALMSSGLSRSGWMPLVAFWLLFTHGVVMRFD